MNIENLHQFWRNTFNSIDFNAHSRCTYSCKLRNDCIDCAIQQNYTGKSIDYSCENIRKIYILRYLHVHSAEVENALNLIGGSDKFPTFSGDIKVLSLGGGPGSDILGFKNFVIDGEFQEADLIFTITRLDRESQWNALANEVIHLTDKDKNLSFRHNKTLKSIEEFNEYNTQKYNALLISYLISELDACGIESLKSIIKKSAAKNCILIINDRNEDATKEKIAEIFSELNILERESTVAEKHCGIDYPKDLYEKLRPKILMKSIRIGSILE